MSRAPRIGTGLTLLVLLALAVRLAWVAGTHETGVDIVGLLWRDAFLAPVGIEMTPVPKRHPAEQADYWLGATADLPRAETTAAECMGAAWVLDGPSYGFLSQMLQETPWAAAGLSGLPDVEFNQDAIARAEQEYERRCAAECVRLAAEAVRREPENVEWRRMQALLQFSAPMFADRPGPRSNEWQAVLDAAASVDQDNALYDYLAALESWRSSAEYDYDPTINGLALSIHDPPAFEAGVRRFERGLGKPGIEFGDSGLSSVPAFLAWTSLPKVVHGDVACSRLLHLRMTGFPTEMRRWQEARALHLITQHRIDDAIAVWRDLIAATRQFNNSRGYPAIDFSPLAARIRATIQIRELAEERTHVLSTDDERELDGIEVAARDRTAVLREAGQRKRAGQSVVTLEESPVAILPAITLRSAVLCGLLSLVGCAILWLKRVPIDISDHRPFGAWRHAAAWVVAYGLTACAALLLPDRAGVLGDALRKAIDVAAESWVWIAVRWMSYYGCYAAIALVPATVLLLSLLMTLGRAGWPLHRGEFTRAVVRRCSISLAALGVLWLGISFAATPALIRLAERDFHSKMDYFRDPEGWLEEVRRVIDEVEAERSKPEGGPELWNSERLYDEVGSD